MEDTVERGFPEAFGASPEEFLVRYESLIYKVIHERTRKDSRFEAEDLFNDFFIHISEDNFRRLRSYRAECQATTYLGKVLRNFICDQYRKKDSRFVVDSLEELAGERRESVLTATDAEDIIQAGHIREAFKETFSRLSNRDKLIFDLSMDEGMSAKQIGELLGVKVKAVYKVNEKIKKRLREELAKRGIEDF